MREKYGKHIQRKRNNDIGGELDTESSGCVHSGSKSVDVLWSLSYWRFRKLIKNHFMCRELCRMEENESK